MRQTKKPDTPAPKQPIRAIIVGSSCSGKSTFAKKLSNLLRIPHIELDSLHWRENWEAVPAKEFRQMVEEATSEENWIVDGNYYQKLRNTLWTKATHVIWLDYPFLTVFSRAVKRTFTRVFTKQELFSGNRESFGRAFFSKNSIILWVLKTYWKKKKRYQRMFASSNYPDVKKIRIYSNITATEVLDRFSNQ